MKWRRRLFYSYIVLLLLIVIVKFTGSITDLMDTIEVNKFRAQNGFIRINLVPFQSIKLILNSIPQSWALRNIVGNLIPFMPFGFLLPYAFPKTRHAIKVFIIGIISIFLVEVLQFKCYLGSFDVDDILLNMIGIMGGYMSYTKIYQRMYHRTATKNS